MSVNLKFCMIKRISLALMLSLFLQLGASALSPLPYFQYTDLDGVDYRNAIVWTLSNGITQGYNPTEWKPEECITRAQLIKMMVEYRFDEDSTYLLSNYQSPFSDVNGTDWFAEYVGIAEQQGIVEGYSDGTFRPNQCVNRVEAMKVAVETLMYSDMIENQSAPLYFDDKTIVDMVGYEWYSDYAKTLFENRLVGTTHTQTVSNDLSASKQIQFLPAESMTRKEVSKMMYEINVFISSQVQGGDTYENTDYGFDLTIPESWGEITVINPKSDMEGVVDTFQIVAENGESFTIYVADIDVYNGALYNVSFNYITENNEYKFYLSWPGVSRDETNFMEKRKIEASKRFKVELNFSPYSL